MLGKNFVYGCVRQDRKVTGDDKDKKERQSIETERILHEEVATAASSRHKERSHKSCEFTQNFYSFISCHLT